MNLSTNDLFVKEELEDESYNHNIKTSLIDNDLECEPINSVSIPNESIQEEETVYQTIKIIDSKKYSCFLCALPICGVENLSKHYASHPEKWTRCQLCTRDRKFDYDDFNTMMDFYKHMKMFHVQIEVGISFIVEQFRLHMNFYLCVF